MRRRDLLKGAFGLAGGAAVATVLPERADAQASPVAATSSERIGDWVDAGDIVVDTEWAPMFPTVDNLVDLPFLASKSGSHAAEPFLISSNWRPASIALRDMNGGLTKGDVYVIDCGGHPTLQISGPVWHSPPIK